MAASCLRRERRQIDFGRAPAFVPQRAAGGRLGRHVADELHHVGIVRGRLGEGAFHAIDHRLQGDVAGDGIAALVVQFAHGRADLVVGVAGDVFHQEVHQARIALQDAEHLQGAVGSLDGGRGGRGGGRSRFGRGRFPPRELQIPEGLIGERAAEQQVEETAKCQRNPVQCNNSNVLG